MQYELCSDSNSYTIDNEPNSPDALAVVDTNCDGDDFLAIDGLTNICSGGTNNVLHSKICGALFNIEETTKSAHTALCGKFRSSIN